MLPSKAHHSHSHNKMNNSNSNNNTRMMKLFAALFYAGASAAIMLVNKVVLYAYGFPSPSFLALSQFMCTIVSLYAMRRAGIVSFPPVTRRRLANVFPLPLLYLGNATSGLSGTQSLSIPMFTVLRRMSMLMTMFLEWYLLGYRYSGATKASVGAMLFGSFVAAIYDLAFDSRAYTVTMMNNAFTAASGVITKKKLVEFESPADKESFSMFGLMFMNSLLSAPILLASLLLFSPSTFSAVYEFPYWSDPKFVLMFFVSSVMGTVLQFSIFLSTKVNSALGTVVTGVLKNVLTSYIGMVSPSLGYSYSWNNFLGINISMLGGIWYAYIQFAEKKEGSASVSSAAGGHEGGDIEKPPVAGAGSAAEAMRRSAGDSSPSLTTNGGGSGIALIAISGLDPSPALAQNGSSVASPGVAVKRAYY